MTNHKYVVYGNKKFTAIYVARSRLLNLSECIFATDKKQAEECKIINPELKIIKPWKNKKEYLEFRKKRINEDLKKYKRIQKEFSEFKTISFNEFKSILYFYLYH